MTVLADGRVLVAGGVGEDELPLASAELWDPATGRFTPTGNMRQPRTNQSATLLADGRVLLVGGGVPRTTPCPWNAGMCPPVQDTSSAEIFDPTTGKFTRTGSMIGTAGYIVAIRLEDGRVLVAGGPAELYDPGKGVFRKTAQQPKLAPEFFCQLANGKILVFEYAFSSGDYASNTEIFDPVGETFTPTAIQPKANPGALISDGNGNALFIESYDFAGSAMLLQTYFAGADTFGDATPVSIPPIINDAFSLSDRSVLILVSVLGPPEIDAYLLDPVSANLSPLGPTTISFQGRSETRLLDGRILFCGGDDGAGDYEVAHCQLFVP